MSIISSVYAVKVEYRCMCMYVSKKNMAINGYHIIEMKGQPVHGTYHIFITRDRTINAIDRKSFLNNRLENHKLS